jgi:hypothetical protein
LAGCGGFGPADEEPVDYEEVLRDWSDEDISGYREVVEAKEDVDLLGGYLIVELDVVTAEALVNLARERGVDPSRAASDIIRDAVSGRDQGDCGGNG